MKGLVVLVRVSAAGYCWLRWWKCKPRGGQCDELWQARRGIKAVNSTCQCDDDMANRVVVDKLHAGARPHHV